jgi:hypothetical protein
VRTQGQGRFFLHLQGEYRDYDEDVIKPKKPSPTESPLLLEIDPEPLAELRKRRDVQQSPSTALACRSGKRNRLRPGQSFRLSTFHPQARKHEIIRPLIPIGVLVILISEEIGDGLVRYREDMLDPAGRFPA